jgi:hypothetical protein
MKKFIITELKNYTIEQFLDKFDMDIKFPFDIKIKEQKIKKFILELKPLTKKAEFKRKMF